MTRFLLIRHGETEWNLASRIQGHSDSALTPAGLAQARALAQRLATLSFDALVASDLPRAFRTAQVIAKRTGHAVIADARLRERNFGVGEGLTYGEIDHQYPEVFSRVRTTDPDYVIPGGESRRQFYVRVKDAFESLAGAHEGKCVAIVAHGGVLASLYRVMHGLAISAPHPIPIPNAALNAVRFESGSWIVERWGDTDHLEAAEPFEEL
jgi:2,3-bisphosphoglycerate-dependent phosphoglycerate mutase